jgi:hypothetical protein
MSLVIICDFCEAKLVRTEKEYEPWIHDYKTRTDCCPECDKKKRDKKFDDYVPKEKQKDVCVWGWNRDENSFFSGCGKRWFYHGEYIVCPFCGKKIEVIQ